MDYHPEIDILIHRYRVLLWLGFFMFVVGIIADLNALSWISYLILIGPATFFSGIALWLFLRIRRPIVCPYQRNKYASTYDAVLAFLFENFLMEFFGLCVAVSMIWVIHTGLKVKNEILFKDGIELLKSDLELRALVGEIQYTGIMSNVSKSNSDTVYEFSVYGSSGATQVIMRLADENGKTTIKSVWLGP